MVDDVMNKEIERLTAEVENKHQPLKKPSGLIKEKSLFRQFTDTFFEADRGTVAKSIVNEIIEPQVKSFIASLLTGWINRRFWGTGSAPTPNKGPEITSIVRTFTQPTPYSTISTNKTVQTNASGQRIKQKFSLADLIFNDFPSASDFLNTLKAEIARCGSVTVAQIYETMYDENDRNTTFVDLDYPNNYFGWTNLDTARIVSVGRYYQLVLPKPIQLD